MAIIREQILEALKSVNDPELQLDIVSLGLVYEVKVENGKDIFVKMSLTTPGCPLVDYFMQNVKAALRGMQGVGEAKVTLTFDPPWKPSMMSEGAKAALGIEE